MKRPKSSKKRTIPESKGEVVAMGINYTGAAFRGMDDPYEGHVFSIKLVGTEWKVVQFLRENVSYGSEGGERVTIAAYVKLLYSGNEPQGDGCGEVLELWDHGKFVFREGALDEALEDPELDPAYRHELANPLNLGEVDVDQLDWNDLPEWTTLVNHLVRDAVQRLAKPNGGFAEKWSEHLRAMAPVGHEADVLAEFQKDVAALLSKAHHQPRTPAHLQKLPIWGAEVRGPEVPRGGVVFSEYFRARDEMEAREKATTWAELATGLDREAFVDFSISVEVRSADPRKVEPPIDRPAKSHDAVVMEPGSRVGPNVIEHACPECGDVRKAYSDLVRLVCTGKGTSKKRKV